MTDIETAADIEAAAASWVLRLDREKNDPKLRAELEAWLGDNPRRHGAWLKAEAAWAMLDQMPWPESQGRGVAIQSPTRLIKGPHANRRQLLMGGLGGFALIGLGSFWAVSQAQADTYATALGEIRKIPLGDGSVVNVNTASRISVSMHKTRRQVRVEAGEAWFEVAPDADRPFMVEARDLRIRADAAAFSVLCTGAGAEALITDGVVDVSGRDTQSAQRLAAGGMVKMTPAGLPSLSNLGLVEISRRLAWRDGNIELDGETLSEAVAEFNRYNARKLAIKDTTLASQKLYGAFHLGDPEAFAKAVQVSLGAGVSVGDEQIEIGRQPVS